MNKYGLSYMNKLGANVKTLPDYFWSFVRNQKPKIMSI